MPESQHFTGAARAGAALVPVLICLELFGGMIQGWIIPLLGEIGAQYDLPGGAVSWILTVGLLSSAVSVPLMTMLADRYSTRILLVVATVLTAAGSVLIAFAPSFPLLLLGSIIQGPVAALLPLEMSLLKRHRPGSANKIVGALVGMLTFGVAIGSLLGGIVMQATGNLAITQFIGAAPLVLLAVAVGFAVPSTPGDRTRRVDWAGASTFGVALIGIMYGLSEGATAGWTSPTVLGSLAVGVLALVVFLAVEQRATDPLFNVRLLRTAKLGVPLLLGALVAMTVFGSQTPTVLFLSAQPDEVGYGVGASTAVVGLIFAVTALFATAGSFAAAWIVKAIGAGVAVMAGCVIAAAGLLLLTTGPTEILITGALFCVISLGSGVVLAVLPGVVIDRAPESVTASVSGLYNTGRTLGGSLAGAFVASVMTIVLASSGSATGTAPATPFLAFQIIWFVFAAVLAIAAVLALSLTVMRRARTAPLTDSTIEIGATR